jgi:hypothetical protein
MTLPKSTYESMLEGVLADAKKFSLTEKENFQVRKELHNEMDSFIFQERIIEKQSEKELLEIVLNA